MNEISLQAFKEKLNIYYSKDNGKIATENIVENFSRFAVSQNKENNPFFYSVLLSTIKHSNIPLNELTNLDNTVMRQVLVEATKTATEYQQKANIDTEKKKDDELVQNIPEKTEQEKIEQKQKVNGYIEKYGGFEEFLHQATKEEIDAYTEDRKNEKVLDVVDELLVRLINNSETELTEEQKKMLKDSIIGEKFGYDEQTGTFAKSEEAKAYAVQLENMRLCILQKLEVGKGKLSKKDLEEICENHDLVMDIKSAEAIREMVEQLTQEYKKEEQLRNTEKTVSINAKVETLGEEEVEDLFAGIEIAEMPEENAGIDLKNAEKTISINVGGETLGEEEVEDLFAGMEIGGMLEENVGIDLKLENYLDIKFANMIDFAEGVKEEREGDDREEAVEPAEPEYNKVEPVLKKSEQIVEPFESDQVENQVQTMAEEESYQAPIIEEEKKGLAKLIDKLRDSKNPVAKFLFNRISSFQNRDAKKLNETNPIIQPDEYTERPSKGRFGVGDSELMPNGTGIRNSFIRVGEGIMKLFQGNKAEKEPIQTRTPINPNHNPNQNEFDARYAVDLKDNAAANGIIVPSNVKSKKDNANNSREGVSSRDEGPSFDD